MTIVIMALGFIITNVVLVSTCGLDGFAGILNVISSYVMKCLKLSLSVKWMKEKHVWRGDRARSQVRDNLDHKAEANPLL